MTDDIVTRLRREFDYLSQRQIVTSLLPDAADEIERLRAELKLRTAERDQHLKWSRTYELELRELHTQKKNLND